MGVTPEEQVFRERRNSRRCDRRQAQEQAEQEARQHRENPLLGRNLNPDFVRAMNTPSEVGGVLAQIADGLPWTPDAEGYRRLLTRAANHLLPLAHPPIDLRHAINSRRDAQSSINASRERRHENEIRRREEYDRDHGVPARSQATRVESAMASTGGTTRRLSRHHVDNSPPGTDITIVDMRTRVEYRRSLHVSGPFSGPLTSKSPTLTSTNLSMIRAAGWLSTPLPPEPLGQPKM
jgi:hypothetical protein